MFFNRANRKHHNWTTERLISLSNNLKQAYYFGSDKAETTKTKDAWTTDKYISLSRYLGSAYGVDF